jgi:site-specific recombinase XerD
MRVAYLFHQDDKIFVPFYDYDPVLFQVLVKSKTGVWDYSRNHYVMSKKGLDDDVLRRLFQDRPRVEFCQPPGPYPRVSGFFDRPWSAPSPGGCRRAQTEEPPAPLKASSAGLPPFPVMSDASCLIESLELPELFSPLWAERLESELRSRKYSPRTIRSYLHYNKYCCRRLQKRPEDLTAGDIRDYLAYLDKTQNLSTSSMNMAISALKFFYKFVLGKDITREQRRPRHDKKLPGILSESEVKILLDCEKNPKHRLLLMLTYSSGLRVSEVVALRKEDLDFQRKVILIRIGKGRKDRYTLLSDRAAEFISQYCLLYEVEGWLFPGISAGQHLSIRSAQNIFTKALKNAQIHKPISIHSLRHTFATHLLENGTDIRYIQELLGHSSLRTTQRYTHIARRTVLKIRSPLDTLPPD